MRTALAADRDSAMWLVPDMGITGISALSTTRNGGVSAGPYAGLNVGGHVGDDPLYVEQNRRKLEMQLPPNRVITWLSQVHGSRVIYAPADYEAGIEADAVWSDRKDFVCAVMTADCLPILLADRQGHCIAAVHGGWRGLASHILQKTLDALPVPPSELVAWLGPAIGPTAFEVGADVLAAFYLSETDAAVQTVSGAAEKYWLDLSMIAGRQLLSLGLAPENISGGDVCTFSDPSRFYSHRRDGVTGRMATLIYFSETA